MENKVNHRQTLGRQGENIACSYLEGMGHTILERNWRSGHLEIDIISVDPEGIHFVEVKARQKSIQAPPQDNVDAAKQRRIAKPSPIARTSSNTTVNIVMYFFEYFFPFFMVPQFRQKASAQGYGVYV